MSTILYTRKQVAEIFLVHPLTVRTWERKGMIEPSFYVSNRPRYTVDDMEKVARLKMFTISENNSQTNG